MSEDEILQAVKAYLKITWTSETNDKNLLGMIRRGKRKLIDIAGAELEFKEDSLEMELLLDYCRYTNSQALEMFETNFSSELTSLHYNTQIMYVDIEEDATNEN